MITADLKDSHSELKRAATDLNGCCFQLEIIQYAYQMTWMDFFLSHQGGSPGRACTLARKSHPRKGSTLVNLGQVSFLGYLLRRVLSPDPI